VLRITRDGGGSMRRAPTSLNGADDGRADVMDAADGKQRQDDVRYGPALDQNEDNSYDRGDVV
jgi:hypothetical protein